MRRGTLLILWLFVSISLSAQTELQTMLVFESPTDGTYDGHFGENISGNGDLNGDGFSDIVIPGHPLGEPEDERRLYIYLGSAQPDSVADYIIDVPSVDPGDMDSFGKAIAYDGDLNGDGYNDLVVSAPTYDGHFPDAGMVFIYWGGETLSTTPDVVLDGLDYGDDCWGLEFGYDLETSGDFNGDGYDDLVVGSRGPSYYWNGQADVFFGGDVFDTDVDWHVQGEMSEMFGLNLTAGDCNGDSYSDLAVRVNYEPIEFHSWINIYHGGEAFDTTADYTSSIIEFEVYGRIAMDGDFNLDGYDDVAIQGVPGGGYIGFLYGGGEIPSAPIVIPELECVGNERCLFYTELNEEPCLFLSYPLDSLVVAIRHDSVDVAEVAYTWHGGNYNPYGWSELDYFIGDYNGDGQGDILMSTRPDGGPWRFRILTTDYVNVEENVETLSPFNIICFPNPTRGDAIVCFNLPHSGRMGLTVYNIRGQRVRTLATGRSFTVGEHRLYWDGADDNGRPCVGGVYFLHLAGETQKRTKKIVLIK